MIEPLTMPVDTWHIQDYVLVSYDGAEEREAVVTALGGDDLKLERVAPLTICTEMAGAAELAEKTVTITLTVSTSEWNIIRRRLNPNRANKRRMALVLTVVEDAP